MCFPVWGGAERVVVISTRSLSISLGFWVLVSFDLTYQPCKYVSVSGNGSGRLAAREWSLKGDGLLIHPFVLSLNDSLRDRRKDRNRPRSQCRIICVVGRVADATADAPTDGAVGRCLNRRRRDPLDRCNRRRLRCRSFPHTRRSSSSQYPRWRSEATYRRIRA
jgi:hypothetical protein